MSVLILLQQALDKAPVEVNQTLKGALADAERLADQFSEVRPQRYVVPIEKYVGMQSVGKQAYSVSSRHHR